MSDTTDLPDWITVGATVAEVSSRNYIRVQVMTVDRLTATLIICISDGRTTRYRRSDLRAVGEPYGSELSPMDAPAVRDGLARQAVQQVVSRAAGIMRDCGTREDDYRAALDAIEALVTQARAQLGWKATP
jgi:hypothetical protein